METAIKMYKESIVTMVDRLYDYFTYYNWYDFDYLLYYYQSILQFRLKHIQVLFKGDYFMNHVFTILQTDYTICSENWGMIDENALFYRMYYICGGEAYLKKGSQMIRLKPGYFYILPLMNPYTLWHNKEHPLEVLWFHVEIKMDFYIDLGIVEIIEHTPLYHLLESIRTLQGHPNFFSETIRIFDIFLTMLNEKLPLQKTDNPAMKRVLEYINKHISSGITVKELADYAGMDRSYFSRSFKSIFQMSPSQYLYAKRMSEAARALADGATVAEASRVSDYSDEKSFSRAFHKYMEVTPYYYRKSHMVQPFSHVE